MRKKFLATFFCKGRKACWFMCEFMIFPVFCVPAVTGRYGVQPAGFILHLAYLELYIFGK